MIKTIFFDVFGTVVDWRGTIIREGEYLFGNIVNWDEFADDWARHYSTRVSALRRSGGWEKLGEIMRTGFFEVAESRPQYRFVLARAYEALQDRISTTWERLQPWPDAYGGFARLKLNHRLVVLSNADELMSKHLVLAGGLPWSGRVDFEHLRTYKPDPRIYDHAVYREECKQAPGLCMMVAAHCFDLNQARKAGMKTALIVRPGEPDSSPEGLDHRADFIVSDLVGLAEMMEEDSEELP